MTSYRSRLETALAAVLSHNGTHWHWRKNNIACKHVIILYSLSTLGYQTNIRRPSLPPFHCQSLTSAAHSTLERHRQRVTFPGQILASIQFFFTVVFTYHPSHTHYLLRGLQRGKPNQSIETENTDQIHCFGQLWKRETDRQTDRQTETLTTYKILTLLVHCFDHLRQTDRQIDRQTDKQTDK